MRVPVGAVRIVWGTALAAFPGAVLRRCPGAPRGGAGDTVVRALGVRQVVQGVATARGLLPGRWTAVPDALHASTMACLALFSARWRTAALVDLGVAGAFAAGAWRGGSAGRPRAARVPFPDGGAGKPRRHGNDRHGNNRRSADLHGRRSLSALGAAGLRRPRRR
ncbi:hypothetical protein ACFW1F_36845 [Streptomyces bungoensis]|uniref:hypothetical protein n=1 Tax=Streptomyces bungoensis TaxID=285568 RepID=UPI003427B498